MPLGSRLRDEDVPRGAEGAAQQQLMALCSLGFPGPPRHGSHAITESLQPSDRGWSTSRQGIVAAVAAEVSK